MEEQTLVMNEYRNIFGHMGSEIKALPRSGSDRKYYRIFDESGTIIAAYNQNTEENDAFVGFTEHFAAKGLPVPEVFHYSPEKYIYFQKDLGDTNLYTWLHSGRDMTRFSTETKELYRKILDTLILFQTEGIKGLNLDLCYPHRSFDRQSMMWDMNYFKYMLLKLLAVPFNERGLENDFDRFADYLLDAGQDYFLYRDFQTANIMIIGDEPWFIDYQGGRRGAAQYDVASLLYDAKIPMSEDDRQDLLAYYSAEFCSRTNADKHAFLGYYLGFSMIRVMQALGAFGFRGLYEKKPTFTESIVPGVRILASIIEKAADHIDLPVLFSTIGNIPETNLFRELERKHK